MKKKWKEPGPRPYYEKYERVAVENGQDWFEVYRLPHRVYAICEPQHFQEVNAFLIMGEDSAILLDTGMGIGNIKAVVDELWQKPITLINTHFHFDHTGGNYLFEKALVPDDPFVRRTAEEGISGEILSDQLEDYAFLYDYPKWFRPEEYCVRPYNIEIVEDGAVFDLGGRKIEYYRTPGHCNDCSMVYDRDAKILFTGDMMYLGAVYLQMASPYFGQSNFDDFVDSIERILTLCPEVEQLYVSHNDIIVPAEKLRELLQGLRDIRAGKLDGTRLTESMHAHLEDSSKLVQYFFDGFSIVNRE